ncbi:hypothetical protein [Emticicia agri]|uniref:DUF4595 domain-containing protein n=1 Tax=Emticicia agri TaxID=2492393 RepID=A0A4V1ZCW1_9BACT|nr:hypothetical protein [Emticicia agri]RYU94040.1 hypothetical protein EWM59_18900 [Emticicia agri]
MPVHKSLYILLLLVFLTFACKNRLDVLARTGEGETKETELCLLKNASHGHGIVYNFDYDTKKLMTSLEGFADFDRISYENGLPVKAENSRDKSYYILFQYDAKGGLSTINFVGKDSAGKPFEFKSNAYVNTKKQVERINLSLPIFEDILETTITYDKAGNVAKISIIKDGKTNTLLENLSFDDKNSPYLGLPLSNVMLYFVIFSASVGTENTTYFINKNNVTSAKVYSINGDISYNYQYDYNDKKFPTKTRITRKYNGKDENYHESFSYNCP